ncbi:hypothetical protein [Cysteiniphilum sp. QT6929]|uniref:hypothetical protein n=1 Tax=Cysteiniphilum sp. QT6929 TaxID=2975055 RepID=UPI0024B34713|nr:hypothetical protein [Cysteiniphilum sp. QT6929]WHN64818.1 hypothetical protein NYP54_07115 [Cysteiniphilum sp. QT6929]
MAIKILSKSSNDKFFTIEDSSIFSSKSSKAMNPNAVFADAKRNHMEGFAEKHLDSTLQSIANNDSNLVSGNKKDGFTLDDTVYAKLREFYSLENQTSDFKQSMDELRELDNVVKSAKKHAENSTKALDTFKSSVMQALLTSEDIEGLKEDFHKAAEQLKEDLHYNNPKWYIQFKGWIGEKIVNVLKGLGNFGKWLFNKLGIFTTTDLEKRQAALEIDYCASKGVKTIDKLGVEESTQLRLLQEVVAEFDANRVNQDTLVSKKEVDDYITNLIKGDKDLEKALANKDNVVKLIVDAHRARDLNQESARDTLARKNHQPEYLKYANYVQERHAKHEKSFKEDYNKKFPEKNEVLSTTETDPEVKTRPRRLTSLLKEYQEAAGLKNNTQEPTIGTKESMNTDELNIKKTYSVKNGDMPEFEDKIQSFNERKANSVINGYTSQKNNILAQELTGKATTYNITNEDKNHEDRSNLFLSTGNNYKFEVPDDTKLANLLKFITDNTVGANGTFRTYFKEARLDNDTTVKLPRCVLMAYGNQEVQPIVNQLKKDITNPKSIIEKLSTYMADNNTEYNAAKGYNTSLTSDLKNALLKVETLENVLKHGSIKEQGQKFDNSNLAIFQLASENQVTIESNKGAK